MLNLYKFYGKPKTLPLYIDMGKSLEMIQPFKLGQWNESISRADLDPVLHIIAKIPKLAYYYTMLFVKDRWPEGEKAIAADPEYSFLYTRYVIKGRWKEAEPTILKNTATSIEYINQILNHDPNWPHPKGEWPEAMQHALKTPWDAYYYAVNALKRVWPEAHSIIKTDIHAWQKYCKAFDYSERD